MGVRENLLEVESCLQAADMVVHPQRDELFKQGREGLPQGSHKSGVPS